MEKNDVICESNFMAWHRTIYKILTIIIRTLETHKLNPLSQNFTLNQCLVWVFPQKLVNFHKPYLTRFLSYGSDLVLFGKIKEYSTSLFLVTLAFEEFILVKLALTKNAFLLTFKRTCNVLVHIFELKHILDLGPTSKL